MPIALESLPASTPEPELCRAARQALDPVRQQVEKRLLAERVVQWAVGQLAWLRRTEVDEVRLRRHCREIKQRKANKEMAARKAKLIEGVKLQVFLYFADLENDQVITNEEFWDSKLWKGLEHTAEQELRAKLSGEEVADEVRKIVRQIIDDEMGIEDEEEN